MLYACIGAWVLEADDADVERELDAEALEAERDHVHGAHADAHVALPEPLQAKANLDVLLQAFDGILRARDRLEPCDRRRN